MNERDYARSLYGFYQTIFTSRQFCVLLKVTPEDANCHEAVRELYESGSRVGCFHRRCIKKSLMGSAYGKHHQLPWMDDFDRCGFFTDESDPQLRMPSQLPECSCTDCSDDDSDDSETKEVA